MGYHANENCNLFLMFKCDKNIQKLHIYSLSTSGGKNWACFRSTGSGFRDMGQFLKSPYLGMKLGHWPKCQKLYIYFLNYPRVPSFTPVCSTVDHFQDIVNFVFPIGHNVKFQSFLKHFNFEISEFQEANFVRTVTWNIQKRFRLKRIKTVRWVAFWNFHPHRVPC